MNEVDLYREKLFLAELASVDCLGDEEPELDGAALVVRISHDEKICEALVEVRLPGTVNEYGRKEPSEHGRLLVFLQNAADVPVKLRAPEFILTGGLALPWKVGLVMMSNIYRGEMSESLCWQVVLSEQNDLAMLASDVARILSKGRLIVAA